MLSNSKNKNILENFIWLLCTGINVICREINTMKLCLQKNRKSLKLF